MYCRSRYMFIDCSQRRKLQARKIINISKPAGIILMNKLPVKVHQIKDNSASAFKHDLRKLLLYGWKIFSTTAIMQEKYYLLCIFKFVLL